MNDAPDAAAIIMVALGEALEGYELPPDARAATSLRILADLREAGCLREAPNDWPELPAGSQIITDMRIIEWLAPDSGEPKFKLRYPDDMRWASVFAMLGIAQAEMTKLWAER